MTHAASVTRRTALKALGTSAGALPSSPGCPTKALAAFAADPGDKGARRALKVLTAGPIRDRGGAGGGDHPRRRALAGREGGPRRRLHRPAAERSGRRPCGKEWLAGLAALDAEAHDALRRAVRRLHAGADGGAPHRHQPVRAAKPKTAEPPSTSRATSSRSRSRRRWTRCSATSPAPGPDDRTPLETFFADHQAGHDPRLLHVRDRHPPGAALQGQPDPGRVRRLPDRGRQGLPALRAEGGGLTWPRIPTLDLDLAARHSTSRAAWPPPSSPAPGPGTRSSWAAAPPAAWPRSSSPWPASRCCCSRRAACSTTARSTGRWSGRTRRRAGSRLPPDHARDRRRRVQLPRPALRQQPRRSRSTRRSPSYAGNTFTRNWVVNEKEHPTTGTPYSWVRARVLGGKTNFWGRVRHPLRAAAVQGREPRRLRRRLADRLRGREAVLRQGGRAARLLGHQAKASTRCRTASSSAPIKLNCVEVHFKRAIAKMGRQLHPRAAPASPPTASSTTSTARAAWAAGAAARGCDISADVPLADRAHLPRARQRQPHHPAVLGRAPRCSSTRQTGRAARRARHRREHARGDGLQGARWSCWARAASTARASCSTRSRRGIRTAWATRRASSAAT